MEPSTRAHAELIVSPNPESISHSINVIEPRCNQGNLKNCLVREARLAEPFVISWRDPGCVSSDLHNVIKHNPILLADWRTPIVVLECLNQLFIKCDPAQKLCVRFDSIMTAVRDRNNRGDHFVLPASQRQLRGHQHSERSEGMIQSIGNQTVRIYNPRSFAIQCRMHRRRIFNRIELALCFHRFANSLVF